MSQSSQLILNQSCLDQNLEVNKNAKHLYNRELQTGFHFWVRQLRFQFWVKLKSGNCGHVSSFGRFPVLGRHKGLYSKKSKRCLVLSWGRRSMKGSMVGK